MIDFNFISYISAGVSSPVMGGALNNDALQMIIHAGLIVKFVLLILLFFSVMSWAIIFMKYRMLRKAKRESASFLELFRESGDMKKILRASKIMRFSPIARLFSSGHSEFERIRRIQTSQSQKGSVVMEGEESLHSRHTIMDNLERSLRKETIDQGNRMERALNFLATTGNTAPFIGLFGTVWGIMESFRGIGLKGSASLAVVAPGISEALIATAAGLVTAIPAVMAFNYFSHEISAIRGDMDIFASDFLSMVERQFFKKHIKFM